MSSETPRNKPYSSLEIQNVVASSAISQEVDLRSVAADLPSAEFDAGQFPGLIFRPEGTQATSLIFRSGKMTCTGAATVEGVHEAIHATVEALEELGLEADSPDVTVQNIVSDADLGESLHLEAITIGLGLENVEYEPEQFPGLIYRLPESNPVVLLFGSGKLVITGARTLDEAEKALSQISERLSDLGLVG
ncbi:TATA-box-binding protein [Halococcus sp. IIIV-5B]|uniref:TATA-box-binding protein n=1 Tax=Halococcus sp. IIIV-5B TaxID=2321230 RepID=UPI000E709E35|nr:TATA-box-binding protein [Halococcus sp. IIIV-5B]RJT07507.1 TATA-box-binding protein [Halococcus sp. IIIV-5B]